jgi:hypothetical protein
MPDSLPTEVLEVTAGLPAEAAALVRAYQRASKADATVRAYRSDALVFQDWCARFAALALVVAAGGATRARNSAIGGQGHNDA